MAAKTQEQLKTLSDEIFTDNIAGAVSTERHREFNNDLIDSIFEMPEQEELIIDGGSF